LLHESAQCPTLAASTWEDEVIPDVRDIDGATGQWRHQATGRQFTFRQASRFQSNANSPARKGNILRRAGLDG